MREMTMKYNYRDYSEIPANVENYLLAVADIRSIGRISLEDINEFLNEMEDHFDD